MLERDQWQFNLQPSATGQAQWTDCQRQVFIVQTWTRPPPASLGADLMRNGPSELSSHVAVVFACLPSKCKTVPTDDWKRSMVALTLQQQAICRLCERGKCQTVKVKRIRLRLRPLSFPTSQLILTLAHKTLFFSLSSTYCIHLLSCHLST